MQYRPNRRKFLYATGSSVLLALSSSACSSAPDRQLSFATLAEAEIEMRKLAQASALNQHASMNWVQTLVHCAQSIEYSMSGFPQAKSAIFQHTLGAAAYSVFSWRGRMTHDLAEPIPAAPVLNPQASVQDALARLHDAISQFQTWQGALKPHFAYGDLDKKQYELAHAMHMANHFSSFSIKT